MPLHHVLFVDHHVVPQVIEPELVVGAVDDVARVRLFSFLRPHVVLYDAHRKPEEFVHGAHPVAVPLGEVVVDRYDVDVVAGERVERDRQRGHKRLTLAGRHLRDLAVVQDHAAHHLHVEMPQAYRPLRRLPDHGEDLRQHRVQRPVLCLAQALLVFRLFLVGCRGRDLLSYRLHLGLDLGPSGFRAAARVLGPGLELRVRKRRYLRLQLAYLLNDGFHLAQLAVVLRAEYPAQ